MIELSIHSYQDAQKAINQASIMSVVFIVISLITIAVGLTDVFGLIDVFLLCLGLVGYYKKSTIGAVLVLAFFLITRIALMFLLETVTIGLITTTIGGAIIYAKAIMGCRYLANPIYKDAGLDEDDVIAY